MKLKNFFERIGKFLRDVRSEIGKVIWPTRQESILYTGVVVGAVVLVAAMIYIIDQALSLGLTALLGDGTAGGVK